MLITADGMDDPKTGAGNPGEVTQAYPAIAVAIDNSPFSGYAEVLALQLARAMGSSVTGLHAYTGRYHRHRFQALEGHLPERYRREDVLEYQRSVHSVLIERGLELISTEYMTRLRDRCAREGIAFTEKIADGKNADVITEASCGFSLMTMGAEGLGRIEGAPHIGSNTRRVLRHGRCDLLIARKGDPIRTILVGIDGSEEAGRMAAKAAVLAYALNAHLVLATAFDPGLHRTVFGSLSGVLSASAGNAFRFSEQEDLHNQVIDTSLASLYTGYLEKAEGIIKEKGVQADTCLLQGKPYAAICTKAAEMAADLIVVSRNGMHRGIFGDIGSNAENIAERAGTNVLVVTGGVPPPAPGCVAGQPQPSGEPFRNSISWSDDASKRLERVPAFARTMATMAIERYAKENGITHITPAIMEKARERMGI